MTERYDLRRIYEYWVEQANTHGQSYAASWSDIGVIRLEIQELLKHLQDGDRVLDVGCANGYSTAALATARRIEIRGLDYIPEMIKAAECRRAELPEPVRARTSFAVGNIMDLKEPAGQWDKVVVVRVLINLGNWENQKRALEQCARMLRTGGLLLLSEATLQGWKRLNSLRKEWGLEEIPMPAFNTYLDQEKVVEAAAPLFDSVSVSDFASTYFVGTRVLKPLLAKLAGNEDRVADPLSEWNRWFSMAPAWGDYGTQKLFVLRRR